MTAALALAGMLGAQGTAAAQDYHSLRLISTGDDSRHATVPYAAGDPLDPSRVFFGTYAALPGTGDTDSDQDIYERRRDGSVRLTSVGDDDAFSYVVGFSEDASRVFFIAGPTPMPRWRPEDSFDIWERHVDGTLRLIADGEEGNSTRFGGASVDGEHVFFETMAGLVGADTDGAVDVYDRRADGGLRLISTGGDFASASFGGASADGSRVLFETPEHLLPEDVDSGRDAYERAPNGELRLITSGRSGEDWLGHVSLDGDRVLFSTRYSFPGTGDTSGDDVYERRGDGSVRLITFAAEGEDGAVLGVTPDGSHVFMDSYDAISGTGDQDEHGLDVYERRADGTVRLISGGTSNDASALYKGVSADGARVFFESAEALPGTGDADIAWDVFERHADGTLRLISTSKGDQNARFAGASVDGTRVFFETADPHPELGDTNASVDIYERRASGELRLISTTRTAGVVRFAGASADGSHVYFETDEALPGTGDLDTGVDVYEHTWSHTPPSPLPANPPPTQGDPPPTEGDPPPTPGDAPPTPGDSASTLGDPPFAGVGGAGAAVGADVTPPVVTLVAPRCSARLSPHECRRQRSSRAAWRTLRGTASDAGGLARVSVNVVRRVRGRCLVYTGRRFARRPCHAARRPVVNATLDRSHWRLPLANLRSGPHVFTVQAIDRAGNTSRPVRRRIRLR